MGKEVYMTNRKSEKEKKLEIKKTYMYFRMIDGLGMESIWRTEAR